MVPTAKMNGEQMAMGIMQQKQQMEQTQQQAAMGGGMEGGGEGGMEGGGMEGGGEGGGEAIQAMLKSIPPSQRKFKGRTGGVTPTDADKHAGTDEERDIDAYAEARSKKNVLTLSNSWIGSLMERGYTSPLIKEVTEDGNQMWFIQDGIDYIADLTGSGVTNVTKATFPPIPQRRTSSATTATIDNPDVLSYEDE
jgi:hypothetical protein